MGPGLTRTIAQTWVCNLSVTSPREYMRNSIHIFCWFGMWELIISTGLHARFTRSIFLYIGSQIRVVQRLTSPECCEIRSRSCDTIRCTARRIRIIRWQQAVRLFVTYSCVEYSLLKSIFVASQPWYLPLPTRHWCFVGWVLSYWEAFCRSGY